MATHSSILAWKIPWSEKPGGLQSMGLQRVRQAWAHTRAHKVLSTRPAHSRQSSQWCRASTPAETTETNLCQLLHPRETRPKPGEQVSVGTIPRGLCTEPFPGDTASLPPAATQTAGVCATGLLSLKHVSSLWRRVYKLSADLHCFLTNLLCLVLAFPRGLRQEGRQPCPSSSTSADSISRPTTGWPTNQSLLISSPITLASSFT